MENPLQIRADEQMPSSEQKQTRLALWLQFPRRMVFLLLAGGLAALGIMLVRNALPGTQISSQGIEEVGLRAGNTFTLLWIAFALSLLLSLVTLTIAYFVLRLEARSKTGGSILRALGRLWIFADTTLPAFALGLLLIWIFAIRLELLPPAGMFSPDNDNPADRLRHLILPVLALVFMPSGLSALAAARRMVSSGQKGFRRWAGGILRLLAAMFRQTGGILCALVMVEFLFAWPGIGRMAVGAVMQLMLPVFFPVAFVFGGTILIGRLLSELFDWLGRFADPQPAIPPEQDMRLKKAHRTWIIFTLVLLFIVIIFTVYGALAGGEAANAVDPGQRSAGPSPEHWLGTDPMGRDLWARIAHGAAVTSGVSALSAILVTLVAFPFGLLAGWLSRKQRWWADLLSDLVLLPADAALFLPAIGMVMLITLWLAVGRVERTAVMVILLTAVAILPRCTRFMTQAWVDAPDGKVFKRTVKTALALFLASLLIAFATCTIMSILGIGLQPPVATLGGTLGELMRYVATVSGLSSGMGILVLWFYLWTFQLAAEALLDGWLGKSAFSWLNS